MRTVRLTRPIKRFGRKTIRSITFNDPSIQQTLAVGDLPAPPESISLDAAKQDLAHRFSLLSGVPANVFLLACDDDIIAMAAAVVANFNDALALIERG